MIDQSQITNEWIKQKNDAYKTDPLLIEKVIRALLLLEGLVKQGLPFIFKGGTALMLHFNSSRRLSIDIDIVLPDKKIDMEEVLKGVVQKQGFTRFELQERNALTDIEKAHYKFYYNPVRSSGRGKEYVLLDILFEKVYYTNLFKLPVQSNLAPLDGESVMVDIPSVEDLLGDKLTAFAPNTTGIPYFRKGDSMSMEIIKQLYDIGTLFDAAKDFRIVNKTFREFANAELSYRNKDVMKTDDVIEDIYQTALNIATRGKDGKANYEELQQGITRIKNFIFSENYHLEKAITHATKAAYLATLLRQSDESIERFDPEIDMKDWFIEQPFNTRLNKLKKSDPESFFYWYMIFKLS